MEMSDHEQKTNADMVREESAMYGESAPPASRTSRKQMRLMRQWVRDVAISMAVAAFIILFLYQPVRVQGTSMAPWLKDEDRLVINKFTYKLGEVKRGDVVVFLYPGDHTKSYIKRVIGLPGDDVRVDSGHVFVNGVAATEPYVLTQNQDDRSVAEMIVPPGKIYVMGDHRSISSDSREFGPVPLKLVYGKAAFVYWPIEDTGTVR